MLAMLITAGVAFGRNIVGVIFRPYETFRRIAARATVWEIFYIGILLSLYFLTAVLVKSPDFRPYLMTRQFVLLGCATTITYMLAVTLFWQTGRLFGSRGNFLGFAIGWAYSLIPTWVWFWMTSLLYVILPPPRTTRALGIAFSVFYLLISATLLFWKVICSYLALRFGLKLDLMKIIAVCAIVLPILSLYSVGMYWLGIFRIPFI